MLEEGQGRYESENHVPTLADHMPALRIMAKSKYRPTRSFTFSTTVLKNLASQNEQMVPRQILRAKKAGR